jgi:hypothetical protein
MTFFFTLPQTLLRQLSTEPGKQETQYVFVPESFKSQTGRDCKDNFQISSAILRKNSKSKGLKYHGGVYPPAVSKDDGIGDELLRGHRVYGWELKTVCQYVIQHSCFGWEATKLKVFSKPTLYLRAFKRTRKRFKEVVYSKIFILGGKNQERIKLYETIHPWRKMIQISPEVFYQVCLSASRESLSKKVPEELEYQDSKIYYFFLPAGECQSTLVQVVNLAKLDNAYVIFKPHPQQTFSINGQYLEENSDVIIIEDKSIPAEVLICRYEPINVFGPPSTIEFLGFANYIKYYPNNWKQENEARLLERYRNVLQGLNS